MIIKHYEIKKNLKKSNYFLFHGPNENLIEEIIDKILKPNFSKNLFNYDEDEIIKDIEIFKNNIFNRSFFDNQKLIVVNRATDKFLKIFELILSKGDLDLNIIIKAQTLEKKSKLRNLFEKNKNLVIVPVYEDDKKALMSYSQNFLNENKIRISIESLNVIIERSKGNRAILKNNLNKILSYSKNKKNLNYEDITNLINFSESLNFLEIVNYCLSKNKKQVFRFINENILSLDDNIIIIKNFLYKLKRLKKLSIEFEKKKNIDKILSESKPPIFWQDKDIIKQQLVFLSLKNINILIKKINKLELTVKKFPKISNEIMNNFFLENIDNSNSSI
jgi:DNA polymerase-3 subunit delta